MEIKTLSSLKYKYPLDISLLVKEVVEETNEYYKLKVWYVSNYYGFIFNPTKIDTVLLKKEDLNKWEIT